MGVTSLAKRKSSYIAIAVLLAILWSISTGLTLPYLSTAFGFQVRALLVFPLLLGLFIWLGFFRVWGATGQTSFQALTGQAPKRERLKALFKLLVALPFTAALLAWMSGAFSALAAYVTASTPFVQDYEVIEVKSFRRRGIWQYRDVHFRSYSGQEEVSLVLTDKAMADYDLAPGARVCVSGRSSVFGTIVESVDRRSGDCTS